MLCLCFCWWWWKWRNWKLLVQLKILC